jgi:hypothetical protein
MSSNWQVDAKGILFWKESRRTVDFDGRSYNIEFVELRPDRYENDLVKELDDHTIKLTIEDPNGLV